VNDYATYALDMAEAIASVQPDATIIGGAFAGVPQSDGATLAQTFKDAGRLDLLPQITFHPYSSNPDSSYGGIDAMIRKVHAVADNITMFQGEHTAHSTQHTLPITHP